MQIRTFDYKNEYPIYGAKFLDNDTLLVAGGTGTTDPEIGNKVTAFKVNFKRKTKKIKKFRELVLPADYNYPTSLDTDGLTIVLGFNEEVFNEDEYSDFPEFSNLRKYTWNNEHLIFDKPAELFDPMERTLSFVSLCYISEDGSVAAVSSSNAKSPKLVVFDPKDLSIKFKINAANNEMISDMHFSSDNKVLCYVTDSTFEAISTITGRSLLKNSDLKAKYNVTALTNIRFISSDDILIAVCFGEGKGVGFVLYSISKLKILKVERVSHKFKKITSLDFCPLFNPHTNQVDYDNSLIAMSGSDNSITMFKYKNFQRVSYFPNTQPFITKISFSPSGEYLVSVTSEGNIRLYRIHTLDLFNDSGSKFLKTVFYSVACIIFVGFIGVVTQYMINKNVFEKLIDQIKKNKADSSSYFKFNDVVDDTTSSRSYQTNYGSPKSIVEEIVYDDMMSKSTMVINRDISGRKRSVVEISSPSSNEQTTDYISVSEPENIVSSIHEIIAEESILSVTSESPVSAPTAQENFDTEEYSENNTPVSTVKEEDQIFSILPIDVSGSEPVLSIVSIDEIAEEIVSTVLPTFKETATEELSSISLSIDTTTSSEQVFSILPINVESHATSVDHESTISDIENPSSTESPLFTGKEEMVNPDLEDLEEPIKVAADSIPYGEHSIIYDAMDIDPKLLNDVELERLERKARIEQLKLELEQLELKKKQLEEAEQDRLEQEKLEQERLKKERLEKERLEKEKIEQERLEQERLEQERLEQEKLEQERLEQERLEKEKIEQERLEQERLEQERLEQERLEQERLEQERLEQERLEQERLEQERLEQERLEQERLEQERLEQERLEQEKLEQERLEQERLEKEKIEQERLEQERLEQEKLEQERLEQEKLEQERLEQERLEQERLEQERLEQERLEQERLEQERLEQERLEQERLEQERLEQERLEQERLEQERLEQERLEQERLEQEKLAQERLERERLELERLEQERLELERLEQERLEQERLEQERLEQERLEQEMLAQERLERERLELERLEQERLEQERLEQERLQQERLEQERLQQERLQQERLQQEKIEQALLEQQRLEKELLAKLEKERVEQELLEKELLAKLEQETLKQKKSDEALAAKIQEKQLHEEQLQNEKILDEIKEAEYLKNIDEEQLNNGEVDSMSIQNEISSNEYTHEQKFQDEL